MLAHLTPSSPNALHGKHHRRRRLTLAVVCVVSVLSTSCSPVSDDEIRRDVLMQLAVIPAAANLTPSVDVQNGIVRLSGKTTASRAVQVQAMRLARSVEGVKVVVNEMWTNNSALSEKVKAALAVDPLVGGIPIEVDARGDTVYLKSDRTNEGHRARAIQIATAVEGVNRVEDLMK
jgi:osmotically-inducible protein OsmY